jgi:hypothetical protein
MDALIVDEAHSWDDRLRPAHPELQVTCGYSGTGSDEHQRRGKAVGCEFRPTPRLAEAADREVQSAPELLLVLDLR